MNEDQRNAMDSAIFTGRVIAALVVVREATGCSIHAAIDVVAARYELLRAERPGDFVVPLEEWGRNVYT